MSWIITGTQKNNWTPADIDTALWLDAADASTVITESGAVSQWNDKSGNNRNATQSAPASRPLVVSSGQNSRDIFRFDGSDDWLNAAYAMPIHGTGVFVAWKLIGGTNANNKTVMAMRPSEAGRFYIIASEHWKGAASISVTDNTNWRISYLSGSATQVFASINGGTVQSVSDTNTATTANVIIGAAGFTIGTDTPSGVSPYANCDLGEIVMVTGTPTDNTRQRIEGYLAHKWGLTANLPNDHPYKLVGPTP